MKQCTKMYIDVQKCTTGELKSMENALIGEISPYIAS